MAKLTKLEARNHAVAMERLEQDILTEEDKDFVFANFHEGAYTVNGEAGAFFTPWGMAFDFALELGLGYATHPARGVDLCAGIGMLSYAAIHRNPTLRMVCVEINPGYVEIGRKLVPEAEWHCLDVMDQEALRELGHFDVAISNPPFGRVRTMRGEGSPIYTGGHAEFKVIDVASRMADRGIFIVPQSSAGFVYSGAQCFSRRAEQKYIDFREQTGIELEMGMGIDTAYEGYESWKGVSPRVEVACVDFTECQLVTIPEQESLFA